MAAGAPWAAEDTSVDSPGTAVAVTLGVAVISAADISGVGEAGLVFLAASSIVRAALSCITARISEFAPAASADASDFGAGSDMDIPGGMQVITIRGGGTIIPPTTAIITAILRPPTR